MGYVIAGVRFFPTVHPFLNLSLPFKTVKQADLKRKKLRRENQDDDFTAFSQNLGITICFDTFQQMENWQIVRPLSEGAGRLIQPYQKIRTLHSLVNMSIQLCKESATPRPNTFLPHEMSIFHYGE